MRMPLTLFYVSRGSGKIIDALRFFYMANNGIAALKFIRSVRQWCYHTYDNERAVCFVAMATPEDINGHAEYTQLADEIVDVPSGPSNMNYGNVELIVELAQEVPVQAVWAGWGHASENPKLPELLSKCSILFLGPTADSMFLLGDKIASTIIAQTLNILTLPWNGTGVTLESVDDRYTNIPQEIYDKCVINQVEDLKRLIGDHFGNVIALFSRDCSIQRRHQKIIEEAPAIICPMNVLEAMELDAIKIAKSVGYVGTGTVEYLYDTKSKAYYFLELNPRLQVEHPCTEIIANVNLPSCQLQVAMGKSLNEIEDLKVFIKSSDIAGGFKYNDTEVKSPNGHVISARITAENAEDGFIPCGGCLRQLNFRSSKNIWGYFSVHAEGKLHKHADSQFGHLFSWGHTREEARKGMVLALKELSIHGEIRTTIDFLVNVMEHPIFLRNGSHVEWLDNLKDEDNFFNKPDIKVIVACGASCIAHQKFQKIYHEYQLSLERGHVPKCLHLIESVKIEFIYQTIKFNLVVSKSSSSSYFIDINSCSFTVRVRTLGNNGLLVSLDNRSYSCFLNDDIMHYVLEIGSTTCLLYKDISPSVLRSPSSGKLISLIYKDGDHVFKGSDYAEIEVMKMVMPLTVTESGFIHYMKTVNSVVDPGTIIARMELDDPNNSLSITPFTGNFENFEKPITNFNCVSVNPSNSSSFSGLSSIEDNNNPTAVLRKNYKLACHNLLNILDGHCVPEPHFTQNLDRDIGILTNYLSQPAFASFQLQSALSRVKNHLPLHIFNSISKFIRRYSVNITSIIYELPVNEIISIIDTHASIIENLEERKTFYLNISNFIKTLEHLYNGPKAYKLSILLEFVEKYLSVESYFSFFSFERSVAYVLNQNNFNCCSDNNDSKNHVTITQLLDLIISHANLNKKNILIVKIIDAIWEYTKYFNSSIDHVKNIMSKLANLATNNHLKVALCAKQFLIASMKPSFELRHNQLESIFLSNIGGSSEKSLRILHEVIQSDGLISDIIPNFFFSLNSQIKAIALEVYLRRIYFSYNLTRINHEQINDMPIIKFYYSPKGCLGRQEGFIQQNDSNCNDLLSDFEDESCSSSSRNNRVKSGIMMCFSSFEELNEFFIPFLSTITSFPKSGSPTSDKDISYNNFTEGFRTVNVCIQILSSNRSMQDEYSTLCQHFVKQNVEDFNYFSIHQITFSITNCHGELPLFYTFRAKLQFFEDKLFRNIEPEEGYLLEIKKMRNYDLEWVSCENPNIHVYFGKSKLHPEESKIIDQRYFVRTIIRNVGLISVEASFEYLVKASEVRLLEALDQLAIITSKLYKTGSSNDIFFNFTPCIVIDPQKTVECIRVIVLRHSRRLFKQKVTRAEMKMVVLLEENGEPIPLRLVAYNDSGYLLNVDLYKEVYDPISQKNIYQSFNLHDNCLYSGLPVDSPYPSLGLMQSKRLYAHSLGTSYVYDFPELFNQALNIEWECSSENQIPRFIFHEMILKASNSHELVQTDRQPGENSVGVVCWYGNISSPFYPSGMDVIIVANDITFSSGSFTLLEANLFKAAGMYARKQKIPLIYLCCCSGAQIGLADEVKNVYKVEWNDYNDYSKGVKYLYLEQEDHDRLISTNSIQAEKIEINGRIIYKITDIFGKSDGIGVENLCGSGLIAGEMSQCYKDIFTISLVTGRAVGIGAYLVRLGRRIIQVDKSSIILTGADALNNVLGKKIYSSHDQLGGVDIMYSNGVSQIVVKDDLEGVQSLLKWLSYYASALENNPSLLSINDNFNLKIDTISDNQIDPRKLIYGYSNCNDNVLQGFFDQKSVFEINKGWAKTVITGRARLGGVPVSFILNDNKTIKSIIPADPADPNDLPKDNVSIGQVLSPDSSFKFSQSIDDSNGEKLPLFIFANFRGFSAGMKDMYNQVLKFGAMIVDSLRAYTQPVFIYIMPNGELRGGSWAVLDA
ncbi:hypothetical protein MXB_2628, partial [Myxobolus squamalis]